MYEKLNDILGFDLLYSPCSVFLISLVIIMIMKNYERNSHPKIYNNYCNKKLKIYKKSFLLKQNFFCSKRIILNDNFLLKN